MTYRTPEDSDVQIQNLLTSVSRERQVVAASCLQKAEPELEPLRMKPWGFLVIPTGLC